MSNNNKNIYNKEVNTIMKNLAAAICMLSVCIHISAQTPTTEVTPKPTNDSITREVVVKNNLIYDATLTPNLTVEMPLSRRMSAQMTVGFNPWTFHNNKKLKHLLLMPELRLWNDSTYHGTFYAVNAFYSHYNVSGVNLILWKDTKNYRYQGDAIAAGLAIGHRWNFLRRDRQLRRDGFYKGEYFNSLNRDEQRLYMRPSRWAIEAEVGFDVGYTWFEKFDCYHCGSSHGKDNKPFIVPNLALSVLYRIGKMEHPVAPVIPEKPVIVQPVDTPVVIPVPPFRPQLPDVKEFGGVADSLMQLYPILVHMNNYRPYDSSRILRKEKGALYVHFPLDKTDLLRDFRDNATRLDRIIDITRLIMADTTSTVKRMQIVGLASIEGNFPHNRDLGNGRAMAMQRYVQRELGIPDSLFDTTGGAEAWSEFRDQINDVKILLKGGQVEPLGNGEYVIPSTEGITLEEVNQLLDIIDSSDQPDQKERRIKQMNQGKTYAYLKENILSDQRNSGYIRVYWDHKPDLRAQAINRASQLLRQGNAEAALRELTPEVRRDPRSFNTLGCALYMTGDITSAIRYFQQAAEQGNRDAQENLIQIQKREVHK